MEIEGPTTTNSPKNNSNAIKDDKARRLFSFESYQGIKSNEPPASAMNNVKKEWEISSKVMEGGDFLLDKNTIWLLQQSSFLDTFAENIRNTDNLTQYGSSVLNETSTIIEENDPDMLQHALQFPDRKKKKKKKQSEVPPHDVVLVGFSKQSFSLSYDEMSNKVSPYIKHLAMSLPARPQTTSSVASQSAQRFALIGPNPLRNNNYMGEDLLTAVKPFQKKKEKDHTWRMDTSLVSEGNGLIITIVNPILRSSSENNLFQSIPNAKSDSLYKILLEQVKNVKRSMHIYSKKQLDLPPLRSTSSSPKKKYRERVKLTFDISANELELFASFYKLPAAVWVTAKLVYFLIASYFQVLSDVEIPSSSWAFLRDRSVTRIEMLKQDFSWPDLQQLMKQSVTFSNIIDLIEHGSTEIDRFYFYDNFPSQYLETLRSISDNKLLNEQILLPILPVAAKICLWAKRVIASIYASMMIRDPNYFVTKSRVLSPSGKAARSLEKTAAPFLSVIAIVDRESDDLHPCYKIGRKLVAATDFLEIIISHNMSQTKLKEYYQSNLRIDYSSPFHQVKTLSELIPPSPETKDQSSIIHDTLLYAIRKPFDLFLLSFNFYENSLFFPPPLISYKHFVRCPFSLMLVNQLTVLRSNTNYLVCVDGTDKSWMAFQLATRMVRIGDKIILLHIPSLDPPKLDLTNSEKQQLLLGSKSQSYLTYDSYIILKTAAIRKMKSIAKKYSDIGFNVFFDKIPEFQDELNRILLTKFCQTSLECYESLTQSFPLPIHDYDFYSQNVRDTSLEFKNLNFFISNKYKNHISNRIQICIEEQAFDPSYILLGSNDEYGHRILSGDAQNYKESCLQLFDELYRQEELSSTFLTSIPKESMDKFGFFEDNNSLKLLTIGNIFCFSKSKTHLMEHLLLEINDDKDKLRPLSTCSFILSNIDKYL